MLIGDRQWQAIQKRSGAQRQEAPSQENIFIFTQSVRNTLKTWA